MCRVFFLDQKLPRRDRKNERTGKRPSGAGQEGFCFSGLPNISMKSLRWLNVTALAKRLPICGVVLCLLLVGNLHATEWQEVSRKFNLAIFIRHRPDSRIEEVRGIGEFHAPLSVLK